MRPKLRFETINTRFATAAQAEPPISDETNFMLHDIWMHRFGHFSVFHKFLGCTVPEENSAKKPIPINDLGMKITGHTIYSLLLHTIVLMH